MANEKQQLNGNKIDFNMGGSRLSIVKYEDGRGAVFYTRGETRLKKNLSLWGTGSALEIILSNNIVNMFMTKADLGRVFDMIPGEAIKIEKKD